MVMALLHFIAKCCDYVIVFLAYDAKLCSRRAPNVTTFVLRYVEGGSSRRLLGDQAPAQV
jgi:hypothetical protein